MQYKLTVRVESTYDKASYIVPEDELESFLLSLFKYSDGAITVTVGLAEEDDGKKEED